ARPRDTPEWRCGIAIAMTHRRELSAAAAYAALLVVLFLFAPAFFQPANLRDVLMSAAPVLVAGVGMTLVILARQIDISIGSQFAICAVLAGLLAKQGLAMPVAAGGAVAAGGVLGGPNRGLRAAVGLAPSVWAPGVNGGCGGGARWGAGGGRGAGGARG